MPGRRAVVELLAGRRQVRELWISDRVDGTPAISQIRELALDRGVEPRTVRAEMLHDRAETQVHQGVLAMAEPLQEVGIAELAVTVQNRRPLVVVLDGVTDPHNVGAILRSAEAAGATGAVLARHGGPAVTPTVAKAAAGAIEHLALCSVPRIPSALARFSDLGVWVVGLDGESRTSLFGLPLFTEPVALVLGAEGEGLSHLARQRCDQVVSIPMAGKAESLNVSAAATLACFEVLRVRGAATPVGA